MSYEIVWMIGFPTAAVAAIYLDVRAYGKIRRLYVGAWLVGTCAACLLPYAFGHFSYREIVSDITIGLLAVCVSAYSNLASPYPNQIREPIIRSKGESDAEYLSALNDRDDEMVRVTNKNWFEIVNRFPTRESRAFITLLFVIPLTLLAIGMLIKGPAAKSTDSRLFEDRKVFELR